MIVVTDTSPVRALAQLGLLHVLPLLFGEVFVPPEVVRELAVDVPGVGALDVASHAFFKVLAPSDPERLIRQHSQLGRGEAEALELALELRADYILVDDGAARAVAHKVGLVALGVMGVLVRAKEIGLVAEVGPLLDRLVAEIGFRISERVRRDVLELAGE